MGFGIAALGAGADLVGSIIQSNSAKAQNRSNERIATDNRAFQEDMSSTAHQREVADLRAAGLNPILSANSGASTPVGSSAQMVSENASIGESLGRSVGSAIELMRKKEEIDNLKKTNVNISSQTALNDALKRKASEDAKLSSNSAKKVEADTKITNANVPVAQLNSKIDTSTFGKITNYFDRVVRSLTGAGNSAKSMSEGRDSFRGYNAQGVVRKH